ncbi:hypothetical protein VTL71DRAFT_6410 [Oculimacula yallundae]|uniref:F-box domain-containing protein n=1 Tax=Oculimacula yallundae TaxID=86028 RepID=A0ABR4BWV8_9HELO
MAAMDSADPLFSRIPKEVLLLIVKQTPGLPSFRNLEKASPTISSLFDEFGHEIIESIISTSLPAQIQSLIRTIVLLQSNKIHTHSLDDFTAAYLRRDGYCETSSNVPPEYAQCIRSGHPGLKGSLFVCVACKEAFPPIQIPPDSSSVILRSILNTACQIQNMTDTLLRSSLDRCLALNPRQLGERWRYIPLPNTGRKPQARPQGIPFKPESSDPFSWTERQRTSRHFWRVQLFFELKLKSRDLQWPDEELARLESLDAFAFWELSGLQRRLREQFGTIVDYLANTGHQHGTNTLGQMTIAQAPNQISLASPFTRKSWEIPFHIDRYALNQVNEAERIAGKAIGNPRRLDTPLRYTEPGNWRKFGFYIWDDERMKSLGFLFRMYTGDDGHSHRSFSIHDFFYRWESILSRDLIEANDRQRIAAFPEGRRSFDFPAKATWWAH